MPHAAVLILLQTGIPGIMLVLTFGQLISQLYVEQFTLPFVNLYGTNFCVGLALFMEYIGVCHFSWLLYHVVSAVACYSLRKAAKEHRAQQEAEFAKVGGSPSDANASPLIETNHHLINPDLTTPEKCFEVAKYCWSTFATGCSIFLVCVGIARGYAVLPSPIGAQYVIFICVLTLLFYLEGSMICIVATQFWDRETFKDLYPRAYKLHELVNRPEGVKRFIIGRQFFTVLSNFLLAQVSVFPKWENDGFDPVFFFIVVRSGLIGVLIVLSFGQLMPELLAAEFPLRFMNMYGSYTICRIALFIESIGIGHSAWFIYFLTRKLCCAGHVAEELKPQVLRVNSQEVLLMPTSNKAATL